MFTDCSRSEARILAACVIGAPDRLRPVLRITWVCRDTAFADWFATPPVGPGPQTDGWRGRFNAGFTALR